MAARHVYTESGRLIEEYVPGVAAPLSHGYDATTKLRTSTTDAYAKTVTTVYSEGLLPIRTTNHAGDSVFYVYDEVGNVIKRCDGRSVDANSDNLPDADTYCVLSSYGNDTSEREQRLIRSKTSPGVPAITYTYTTGSEAAYGSTGAMPAKLLKTTTDVLGRVITQEYNSAGDLTRLSDSTGVDTRSTFDALGRSVTSTAVSTAYPAGVTNSTTYGGLGQILTITEPPVSNVVSGVTHQLRITNTFDNNGKRTFMVGSDLAVTGADPTRTSQTLYDAMGREWKSIDPEGHAIERRFDVAGNVVAVKDQLGRWIRSTFNDRNLVTKVEMLGVVVDPITAGPGAIIGQTEYDDMSRVTAQIDALGRRTETSYDNADRVSKIVIKNYQLDPGSSPTRDILVSQSIYNSAGQPITVKQGGPADGSAPPRTADFTYDNAGRQTSTTLVGVNGANNRVSTSTLNAAGQPLVQTVTQTGVQSGGVSTAESRFSYDTAGRVLTQTVENGATDLTTSYAYDSRGLAVAVVPPRGNEPGADPNAFKVQSLYDELGRPYRTISPTVATEQNGGAPTNVAPQTETGYDSFGDATHRKDERGFTSSVAYDKLSRKTLITHPAYTPPGGTAITPTESYGYDPVGNLTASTDRRGYTTDYEFDIYNRPVKQKDPAVGANPRGETLLEYDLFGNRSKVTDPTGAVTEFGYDTRNQLRFTKQTVRDVSVTPLAGAPGPQSATNVVGGAAKFTYFEYDDLGRTTKTTTPAGVTSTVTYNAADEATQVADTANKTVTSTYDVLSQPVRVTDQLGRQTRFEYDQAGRAVSAAAWASDVAGSYVTKSTTAYDSNSNVVASTSARGYTSTLSYDALGRLVSASQPKDGFTTLTGSYGYDVAGNLTRTRDARGNAVASIFEDDYAGNNGAVWAASKWTTAKTASATIDTQAVAGPDATSGFGRMVTSTGTSYVRAAAAASSHSDAEYATIVRTGSSVTSAEAKLWLRGSGSWSTTAGSESNQTSGYFVSLDMGANQLRIKKTSPGESTLASGTVTPNFAANTNYRVRFQAYGTTLRARIWVDGTPEPSTWTVTTTDAAYTTGSAAVSLKTTAARTVYVEETYVRPLVNSGGSGTVLLSDAFTGSNGAGWNATNWATSVLYGGVADIQSNKGHMRVDAAGNYGTRALAGAASQHTDAEVTVAVTPAQVGNTNTMIWLRGAATFNPVYKGYLFNGYYVRFNYQAGKLELREHYDGNDPDYCGGQNCTLAETAFTFTAGTSYNVRFKIIGTSLSVKVWTGSSEPSNWTLTATDATYTSGRAALTQDNWDTGQAKNVTFDDYVLTNGLPLSDAGYPSTPSTAFDVITTYNPWGLPEDLKEPSTTAHPNAADRTWTSVYDVGGLLVSDKQPGGVTVTNTYDPLARLTAESVAGLSKSYGYDASSRVTSFNHPTGTQNLNYDDRGLLVGSTGPAGNMVANV